VCYSSIIDQLEDFFTQKCGEEEGIRIADSICRVILYADDLAIMSKSPAGLQIMLKCLEEFCQVYKMEVNISKSEVVVFNSDLINGRIAHKWQFKDQDLPIKEEFVYLGILFKGKHGRNGGTHDAGERQRVTANRATHALWKRCNEMDIANANILSYLYGTLIQPILNYGCEVWAPDRLGNIDASHGIEGKCETIQNKFMKRALGVRENTSTDLILNELNRSPTWAQWLRQCIGFWNKVVDRKDDDFVKRALLENVLMATRDSNKQCWSHGLLRCIQRLGVIENFSDILQENQTSLSKIDPLEIDKGISKITDIDWQSLSKVSPRNLDDNQGVGIKSITYATWMASEDRSHSSTYTNLLNNRDDIKCIARLRLRAHNLNVESGRSTSRSGRICRCCDKVFDGRRVIEDEMHFMLECPLYAEDRVIMFEKLKIEPELVDKDSSMKLVMNPTSFEGWKYLIHFIKKCDKKRTIALSSLR
jgi:hypothetical protein